ncbi:DNA protecting protein DprA [Candidatus Gottesmanbacteria bacterium RIFCSPHIGHO2_01_FULL_42_12]|uniref:DNA protecting protein DprA n=1 Tax=Candidatus Gottesmanbacteria bacterium RIFCSPHIGHO2_01_FULL_42_12 TaxID=1798377 RepID=A0A1F5Z5N3_9BACT|nr:MAG: DNA protecting protein DprA [Candidatus Gottesmanbacteria bacterium RIFCSPHIGHO2_01_FULL_42_12]
MSIDIIKLLTINPISRLDSAYPLSLKNIYDPPETLYVIGDIKFSKAVSVVGTRQLSKRGQENTEIICKELVNRGFTIISGLALGIDAVAHWTAIKNGGKTVAVLGAGVDIIYPPQNRELYFKIIESGGAIISEIPPGKLSPHSYFPARNRIISGLSEAIIVTEAQIKSGALITARLAIDQGRDVYAVPGSPGCDYLIENGAQAIDLSLES